MNKVSALVERIGLATREARIADVVIRDETSAREQFDRLWHAIDDVHAEAVYALEALSAYGYEANADVTELRVFRHVLASALDAFEALDAGGV
jgi:hypothetical protein